MKKILAYKWTGYALFFLIGLGLALTTSLVLAKKQNNILSNPTQMCMPAKSGVPDNQENNCDYIYGKLEYLQNILKDIKVQTQDIHDDLYNNGLTPKQK